MTDSPNKPGDVSEISGATAAVQSGSRRRLLRMGASAAPVIMTLASRPVLAQTAFCQAPSGFVSTSINNSAPAGGQCGGRTPGYWKQSQHFGSWAAPYQPNGANPTLFCDVFLNCSVYSGKTLLDVLSTGGGPPDDVGRHIVAAFLNAVASPPLTPLAVLPVATIKAIWSSYASTGSYSPRPGITWDHTAIVSYLVTTMPI